MKKLTHTIIFFVALTLITSGFAPAQNVTEEENQPASKEAVAAEKEIELEKKKAEIAAKVAQKEAEIAEELQKQLEQLEATNTKQLEAAQKQMEVAQKEMETKEKKLLAQLKQLTAAQKQIEIQIPKIEVAVPRISLLGHRGGGGVLVVPAAELKGDDLAAITEDMTVMSRIFTRKLSQARWTTERGRWYVEDYNPFLGRDSGTIEAIYLEGYAALFLMKVDFPLSPSPEAQEEEKTEEEDKDPLWTQMRQEIYAPEEADRRRRTDDRPEEKYDAEKVEELKETLIKTLKHAANIRALKPEQSVILTVIGGRSQSGTRIDTRLYGRSGVSSNIITGRSSRVRSTGRRAPVVPTVADSLFPTVLTVCAKKSDIDAFAKGELSFDQFQERTKIFTSYAKVGSADLLGVEERQVAQVRASVF